MTKPINVFDHVTKQVDEPTFWDFLVALSGLDDYVGRMNRNGELELRHVSDLPSRAFVISRARAHTDTETPKT